jgi:hypothetical protein
MLTNATEQMTAPAFDVLPISASRDAALAEVAKAA